MSTSSGYAPGSTPVTVTDTPTIDLTLTGQDIESDVVVSPDAGNALVAQANGLYVPAATTPCYDPRMTVAEAIALAAGGSLVVGCPVVITDGPTIGTAGNTSITEIELQPTSPTKFGRGAQVYVPSFFPQMAWDGEYDLYNGSNGSITRLADHKGNVVEGGSGVVILNRFPWHTTQVQRNHIYGDVTLTNWGSFSTGGAARIRDNVFQNSAIVAISATVAPSIQGCEFTSGNVNFASSTATTVTNTKFRNATFAHSTASALVINDCEFVGGNLALAGVGAVTLTRSRFVGTNSTRTNSTGVFTVSNSDLIGCQFNNSPGGATASAITVNDSNLIDCTITNTGTGSVQVQRTYGNNAAVTLASPAARGILLTDSRLTGCLVTQARVINNIVDTVQRLDIIGGTFTLSSNLGSVTAQTFTDITMRGASVLAWANGNAATPLSGVTLDNNSTLNSNGSLVNCRIAANVNLLAGTFDHVGTIVELAGTTILTANNVNRLLNKAFSDVI